MRLVVLAAIVALNTASCRTGPPETTGDETRSGATKLAPGATFDDRVCDGTDPVDWKRFQVPSRSPAKVSIYWDNPKVKATWRLVNYFGQPVGAVVHKQGAEKDELAQELEAGTYFLEIRAKKGCSVYTLEVLVGDLESNPYGVPRPE